MIPRSTLIAAPLGQSPLSLLVQVFLAIREAWLDNNWLRHKRTEAESIMTMTVCQGRFV